MKKKFIMTERFGTIIALAFAAGASLPACSAEAPTTSAELEGEEHAVAEHLLEATSAESIESGVTAWNLDDNGFVEGLDGEGRTVIALEIAQDSGRIVNLANEAEYLERDSSGKVVQDTLSDQTRKLVAGLRADFIAAGQLESADGAQELLEWVLFACCTAGTAAQIYQWWEPGYGWTPYCSYLVVGGECSGHPQCGTLAANRGCQYWL